MRVPLHVPTRRDFLAGAAASALPAPLRAQAALPRRGVNLSHWLSWEGRQPIVAADARMIRAAGFDHVRLPLDPAFIGWSPEGGGIPTKLDRLVAAVDLLLAHALSVIVSFHPDEETKDAIELRRPRQDGYVAFWTMLAERFKAVPAERLVFAVMNEPQYYVRGAARWNQLQQRVVTAIRGVDSRRMLALSGTGGSDIDHLDRIQPIADANAFYVFHYYEPYLVTHFGAGWEPFSKEPGALVGRVQYPSTGFTVDAARIGAGTQRLAAEKLVREYIARPWTAATIDRRIALAASWARRAGVRLMCTEFGVLRGRIEPDSRLRWIADVRQALERHGIGWSVWDYADLFGIARAEGVVDYLADGAIVPRDRTDPRRAFDPAALAALGL